MNRQAAPAVVLLALLTACGSSGAVAAEPAASSTAPISASTTPEPVNESPAPSAAGTTKGQTGAFLPDSQRTPGAINPDVTQANIKSTICVTGWTKTVRPTSSYTTALKEKQLASGYAYQGDMKTGDYEEDHLISLEIGGSPDSELNLWPEPYNITDGARTKDKIENKLHSLVCAGTLTLAEAQHAIASNWLDAYEKYDAQAAAGGDHDNEISTAEASTPAATPESDHPESATALCNDGTYSESTHHQGSCSRHGGVNIFYS